MKDGTELTPIKAIVDTGAILSLFPQKLLNFYPGLETVDHTLWGIVDSAECHLSSKLANINVRLVDKNGQKSKKINIIGSFSSNVKITVLLGMKGILESYDSKIIAKESKFVLNLE